MIEQGTPEWHAMRCGKVTASKVADVTAKTKSGISAMRATYMGQLIAERLTGVVADSYTSAAMQHGTDTEEEARNAYAFYHGAKLHPVAFVDHPTIPMSGASPDRYVGDDGLIEVKCPNTYTHIETLLGKSVPGKYVKQMMWQMACTGRQWCDFVSFDPRCPEHLKLFVRRLPRDPVVIAELEIEVRQFLRDLDAKVAELNALSIEAAA